MTTICGLARQSWVWMAADTQTNVYDRPVGGARKVLRVSTDTAEPLLLGVAGDAAIAGLVRYDLPAPAAPRDGDLDLFAHRLAVAITEMAVGRGILNDSPRMDSSLLLGFRGRMWTLTHHQAIAHRDGLAALGSGEGPAIGALWALDRHAHLAGATAVGVACAAGSTFDRYSAGDIQIETLAPPP